MLGQRPAGGLATRKRLHGGRLRLGRRLGLRLIFLELEQLQLELIQQRTALRRLAEPLVPHFAMVCFSFSICSAPLVRLRFRRPAR